MNKRPFSVLLLYPDYMSDAFGHETFYGYVEARSPASAVHEAQMQCVEHNTSPPDDMNPEPFCPIDSPDDLHPLLVLEGHRYGLDPEEA